MKKIIHLAIVIFSFFFSPLANAQLTTVLNFAGTTNGSSPRGSLISDGTFLYGMTRQGGINDSGTVFKIMPDGSGYVKLLDFNGAINGSYPGGSLFYDGSFLYGMTYQGGLNGWGTLFKIMPDGTGYVKLLDFTGVTNGALPNGSLISDGTFLYGMTTQGGTFGQGNIFKILPDGTGYIELLVFDGTNGSFPYGDLISDGTFLYGMTYYGGVNSLGNIFKIMPDGTGYVDLLDFDSIPDGNYPFGSLIYDGTFLYGMAEAGGTNFGGTIFKIMPDGSGYVTLLNGGLANGTYMYGSLVSDGTFLYGMSYQGGVNNMGTVFKIMPDGSGYIQFDLAPTNGSNPIGSLIMDGAFLYGMTESDGANNLGNIFKLPCSIPTDIYGHVTDTNGNVTNGVAIIYPYDSVYVSFDTLQIQPLDAFGNYLFTNVPAGDYLIKIYNDTIAYPNITSTYYGNQWVWDSAAVLTHSALVNDTADVVMIELNLGGGFGLFNGQIIQGYGWGRSPGDPIEGISVKLGITGTSQLVASTITDVNGQYTFSNMPLGNYTVYVDIPGLTRDSSHTFTADSTNSQFLCLDYMVDSVAIYLLPCAVGLNNIVTDQTQFNVYPNPAKENVTIRYSISSHANVQLDIYNVFGVKVQSLVNTQQESGEHNFNFNAKNNNLKPGMYFISLTANGKMKTMRIVVME